MKIAAMRNSLGIVGARVYINDEWGIALSKFYSRLSESLGRGFVALIALDEEEEVYESNVLVIVRSKDPEVVREILRIKRDVEREYGDKIVISPFIAREDEVSIISAFQRAPQDREDRELLREALNKFSARLREAGYAIEVLIPEEEVYESNVLVIVRSKDPEVVREILRIKRDVEREYGDKIVISPFIAREDEVSIISAFQRAPQDREDRELLREALNKFSARLREAGYAIEVLIPEEEVYESNVLVIVRSKDPEVVREILRIKRDVEREYGDKIVISPFIAREDEVSIISAFQRAPQAGN